MADTTNLVLSTRNLNHQQIANAMESYLATQGDEVIWRDLFTSSTGKLIIDLLAGLTELVNYKTEVRGREAYLYTAQAKSSLYLLAQIVGYNPNRKLHAYGKVNVKLDRPADFDFVIPAWFATNQNDLPFVIPSNTYQGTRPDPTDPTIPPADIPYLLIKKGERFVSGVKIWQGEWINYRYTNTIDDPERNEGLQGKDWEILIVPEPNFQVDAFNVAVAIDNTFYTCDGNTIGTRTYKIVDRIQDVDRDSIVVRTDYTGNIFILFGDGNIGPRLNFNSVVDVSYLRTLGAGVEVARGTNMGTYSISGHDVTFTVSERIAGGANEDPEEKIRFVAAKWFQTGGRAVTKHDIEAIALSYPGVISAKVKEKNPECCELFICLLLGNEDPATGIVNVFPHPPLFAEEFLLFFDKYKMMSIKFTVVKPIAIPLEVVMRFVVRPGYDENAIKNQIEIELKRYANRLGVKFRTTEFHDLISDLDPFIQRVYILSVKDRLGVSHDNYPDITLEFNEYFEVNSFPTTFDLVIGADE